MAEERLIDADKDKKYKIKINADGEEELVVEEGEAPAEEVAEVMFTVPAEAETDDESEVGLSPEELAAKREREAKEREEKRQKMEELISRARADVAVNKFATALDYLEKVEELDAQNGELYALRLRAYTRNFTDYAQIAVAAESAGGITNYASDELKASLFEKAAPTLEENIAGLRATVTRMNTENEAKKAERAVKFKKDRDTALIVFAAIFAALGLFAGLTGYFASIIYTVSTGKYLVLTCVFGALSFIALLALAVAARYLNITSRRIRMNKRNTSTQLGRDLLAEQNKLRAFIAVYTAVKGDK